MKSGFVVVGFMVACFGIGLYANSPGFFVGSLIGMIFGGLHAER